jgi:hypothetical protein
MELDHQSAVRIAQEYFATSEPLTRLGWGISGYVVIASPIITAR